LTCLRKHPKEKQFFSQNSQTKKNIKQKRALERKKEGLDPFFGCSKTWATQQN
jgi:hypothetical protein